MRADALDRLVQADVLLVSLHAGLGEQAHDRRGADRTVQRAARIRFLDHRQRDLAEGLDARADLGLASGFFGLDAHALTLHQAHVLGRCVDRQLARDEVVARVARTHAHDVTDAPQRLDVLPQEQVEVLHGVLGFSRRRAANPCGARA